MPATAPPPAIEAGLQFPARMLLIGDKKPQTAELEQALRAAAADSAVVAVDGLASGLAWLEELAFLPPHIQPEVIILALTRFDAAAEAALVRLKASEALAGIPVLLVLAVHSLEDRVRAARCGAGATLEAGGSVAELTAALQRVALLSSR
jgi:DNA-binding response OmpR family regulator